jgi:hypothetical protein
VGLAKVPGVLMRVTNRSCHIARRLELHLTPHLADAPGCVGPKALEFLMAAHVDVETAEGKVRFVFAASYATVVARWANAGFPEPSVTMDAADGQVQFCSLNVS